MAIKENYKLIDVDWAIKKASDPFDIWTFNDSRTESIDNKVQIPKFGGLVVKLSEAVQTPSDLTEIRTRRPIVDLAFGKESRLTLSCELIDAALERGGEQDLTVQQLREVDHTGIDLCWAFPLQALQPVIDLSDIDQDNLQEVPSFRGFDAPSANA